MKKITYPMLLRFNLLLIILLSSVVVSAQTPRLLNVPKEDISAARNSFKAQDAVVNEYSIGVHQATPASREMVTPFSCDNGLVYIITNTPSTRGNISGLNSYDLATMTQTLIKYPLVESTSSSQFINAIGYNVNDNYIYGLLQGTNNVVKIDATGAIEYMPVTGLAPGDYSSGDVDRNGVLYLYNQKNFVSIDLNPSSAEYLVAKSLLNYSATVHDITFSPLDGNIYMMTSDNSKNLLRFNTSLNTITNLGAVTGLTAENTVSFGTAFMDSMGNMYISNNTSGNVYKIATPQNGNLAARRFSSLDGSPGDGARCPNKTVPSSAVKDQACVIDNETITIDLIANDGEGSYPIDVTSVLLMDPVTGTKSKSVTVAGQGTFTVDNAGIVTFVPVAGFTTATISYTIADTINVISNAASITVSVNTTVAPTGLAIQEFCTVDQLTIANLKANGTNIQWYDSATSTTPLSSKTALKQQTYYASQTNASGCESLERFAVTVQLSEAFALVSPETATCTNNATAYILSATFNAGTALTATGNGAPGKFVTNADKTVTWTSSPINASFLNYNVEIGGAENCNSVTLAGEAPLACLAQPFACEDGLAFILTNTGTDQSNYITGLYTLNLSTNVQSLIKYPLVDESNPTRFINGIGYNTLDNYLYGLLQQTNKIARIDHEGNVEYFEISGDFSPGYYSSGDIDINGVLYLYNSSKFVSISLNPAHSNYLIAVDLMNYSNSINDLAYSAIDGNIYMVTSTGTPKLLRYNVVADTITDLGNITGLEAETTNSYGTAFMDSMGNLQIANNGSGNIYKIATPHTGNINATFYSAAMAGLQPGDGARCPNQITFPVANDDTICGTADTDTIINVLKNDGEGSFALDNTSVRLIDPATSDAITSVTIAGEGTFTVDTEGVVTFSPLASFIEASVNYYVRDIFGNQSQEATITVYLNDTEAATGEANQVFCTSSEPTIADLVANGENIKWYDSESSVSPLKPTLALVDGGVYYGTQTNSQGCESLVRLEVTVTINKDIELVAPETVTCDESENTYTIEVSFIGKAPFTITGTGTPGTLTDNMNGSFTWLSDAIASNLAYNVQIQDVNACGSIILEASAPNCCSVEVSCPTFEDLAVQCYLDLPSQTSYTVAEFEALGNGDGSIDDTSCGVIEITAANSADTGECAQNVTRTYTITVYEDSNNNGVRDDNENNVISSTECVQTILVQDTTAPNLVTDYESEITITCDNIPEVPALVFEDACSNDMNVTFTETSTATDNATNYVITRTWTVSDSCGNEDSHIQTINVNVADTIVTTNTELCNDDDIEFDLFSLLSGTYDKDGTWTVIAGDTTLDGSIFNPYGLDLKTYTFKYTLEDEYCSTESVVNITLNDDCVPLSCGAEDVVISKAVTTYADGQNDFFTVTGVEDCGFTIELQIFNRWGAMIYENMNYQNDWNGAASKASIGNSSYVPTGTYYYVVNLKNSGLKPFAGPIYVATK